MQKNQVDVLLYEFLRTHETHLYIRDGEIEVITFIPFYDLKEFVNIAGFSCFDEGGMDCKLKEDCIGINVFSLIEGNYHYVSSYKNCFDMQEWEEYESEILEMEASWDD